MNSRGRHPGDFTGNSNSSNTNASNAADEADLESFKVALKELTFNSRPVIEKLTAMARERARSIPGQVSRTILDNLVFNNPKLRSCFLFLIDSICKNVGEPYPTSFVKHGLVSAYIRVYGEVWSSGDEGQKRDFLRVLPTWNGVIAPEALKQIEVKLGLPISIPITRNIVESSTTATTTTSTTTTSTPHYSRATLKLLQDLQGVFENPPGPHISGIVSEIFRRLVRGGELKREVIEELDFKAKMSDKRQVIEALKRLQRELEPFRMQQPAIETSTSPPAPSMSPAFNFELPSDFQIDLSLLSSIVELNKLNTTANANANVSSSTVNSTHPSQTALSDKHFVEIPVNSTDLLTTHPKLYQVLYDDLSLQCKTCAIRFRDTPRGQELMTEHLDSHFRRNMRLKEKSKRVMARDWFGSEEDWIAAKKDSEISSERAVNIFEDSNRIEDADSQTSHSDIFVEASEEEQSEPVKCDTCQETIPLVWNDDTEQWTFPGCIRNDLGKIVHAACHQPNTSKSKSITEDTNTTTIKPPSKRVKKNI